MLKKESIVLLPQKNNKITDEIPMISIVYDNNININYNKQTEYKKKAKVNVSPKIDSGLIRSKNDSK